jgi:phage shock protein PspC (stress-responsive transcriptional regulator)
MSMRKVITINLNGNAYQVDDVGYEALRAYLERAEAQLAGNPDRAEIVTDLEQAIGDKCDTFLGSHKTVVSASEVEQILKEMGPVEGATQTAEASSNDVGGKSGDSATSADSAQPRAAKADRRLFRLPEQGMMGGVCAGFAAYFNVDVVWVRLAFVLLTIITGVWFFVWLVMLFVMPRANSPEEVAAAFGEPFNARDVIDRAKKKYTEFSSAAAEAGRRQWQQHEPNMKCAAEDIRQGFSNFRPHVRAMGSEMRRAARQQRAYMHAKLRMNRDARWDISYGSRIAAGISLPILSVISAALFVAFMVVLFSILMGGTILSWTPLSVMPMWVAIVVACVAYAIVAGPISLARHTARRYANNGRAFGWASPLDGLLWLALVVLFFWAATQFVPGLGATVERLFNEGHSTISISV